MISYISEKKKMVIFTPMIFIYEVEDLLYFILIRNDAMEILFIS